MNKSLAFAGREKEIERFRALYADRKPVVIVGPAGMGKTALLRQIRQWCPMLLCEEAASLRQICDGLERELGWSHHRLTLIERKNRLLRYTHRCGELITLDHIAQTTPRVSRFIRNVSERVPVWIVCRSTMPNDIGHLWQYIFRFERFELQRLTLIEARTLIEAAVDLGNIQPESREFVWQIYHLSKGVPRILEELCSQRMAPGSRLALFSLLVSR